MTVHEYQKKVRKINRDTDLKTLKKLWNELEDVPVVMDEDGDTVIDADFHLWKKGTPRMNIWHWFDWHCPNGLVKDLM